MIWLNVLPFSIIRTIASHRSSTRRHSCAAHRQKNLTVQDVPAVCILVPDGDVVRHLKASGKAHRVASWPCYHTELHSFDLAGETVGIVGYAVGAPFAVLVAEELFASGCRFLLNLTSAGQIDGVAVPPYFVVIDRALRDEGTSYHYVAPSEFAEADPRLVTIAMEAVAREGLRVFAGRAGQPMRRSGRQPKPLRAPERLVCWLSKWKRLLYIRAGAGRVGVVLGPCHKCDGTKPAGFRKGGGRWNS